MGGGGADASVRLALWYAFVACFCGVVFVRYEWMGWGVCCEV